MRALQSSPSFSFNFTGFTTGVDTFKAETEEEEEEEVEEEKQKKEEKQEKQEADKDDEDEECGEGEVPVDAGPAVEEQQEKAESEEVSCVVQPRLCC
jgi:hypothetical protein